MRTFVHLWQQDNLSDCDIVLTAQQSSSGPDAETCKLVSLPGHILLLSAALSSTHRCAARFHHPFPLGVLWWTVASDATDLMLAPLQLLAVAAKWLICGHACRAVSPFLA
jgi:hypothetical protein